MCSMGVLSDAKLREIYDSKGCHDAGLRAVADAAITADRAARAKPFVPEDMSPANVPMYWRDESSNACAYAAGWNACRTTMLAAPAPSQEPTA